MQTNNLYDSPYFLWPYMPVYPGKTNDFSIHPAFMATQLPVYHNFCRNSVAADSPTAFSSNGHDNSDHTPHEHLQHHRRYPLQHSSPRTHHLPLTKPKKASFTIDAILHGEEERKEEVNEQHSPSQMSSPSPIQHLQQTTPENYLSVQRHQRLMEQAHPYYDGSKPVTPIASAAAKSVQKGKRL